MTAKEVADEACNKLTILRFHILENSETTTMISNLTRFQLL